jgi:hypothetical protein
MTDSAGRRALLWAAIEGDPGLWELEWELNALHPGDTDNREKARRITIELLERGLVTICIAHGLEADCVALSEDEARRAVERDEGWLPPKSIGEPIIRVSATTAGEHHYSTRSVIRDGNA